ncbi:MAG: hypothetical protein JEY96_16930 [Bacteroidales bacterium]|nr:hypothetical protein [Bacteroidales bacterium]
MSKLTKLQLADHWEKYRKSLYEDTTIDHSMSAADILKHRQELEKNPIEWIKFFYPKYASADFAKFQTKAIKRLIDNEEWYEVLSWSRELAKSTITMFVVSHLTLTGKKKNVILTSNSYDNAERLLEPYRANFDSNQRIITYYGKQQGLTWRTGDFATASGVNFLALGAGQSPRGNKNEQIRPDLILVDDFDTDEECRNIDIINKKWDWFEQALYPTRSISNPLLVIFCGNKIAKDCCITRAGEKADHWDVINIRDKNGKSSWIEKNSEEQIDRILSKISTRAAQQEYFNNPLSVGDTFEEMYWGKVPMLNKFRFLISYGDPAPSNSKNKSNSFKSNFLIGELNGNFYIITGYLDHVTNAEYVDWYYYLHDFVNGKTQTYFFTENNTLQDPFYQQVFLPLFVEKGREKGHFLSIAADDRKKPDKFSRIEGNLEPLNKQSRLILNIDQKDNPHMKRLEEQFLLVNPRLNAPADGPDCIEGGVFIINAKSRSIAASNIRFGKFKPNSKRV